MRDRELKTTENRNQWVAEHTELTGTNMNEKQVRDDFIIPPRPRVSQGVFWFMMLNKKRL